MVIKKDTPKDTETASNVPTLKDWETMAAIFSSFLHGDCPVNRAVRHGSCPFGTWGQNFMHCKKCWWFYIRNWFRKLGLLEAVRAMGESMTLPRGMTEAEFE